MPLENFTRTPYTYAGIGSRATPVDVLVLMRSLARALAPLGWTLRTGGAPGADQAFLAGARDAGGSIELYLPWPNFENLADATLARPAREAYVVAERHHPGWECLGRGARALHARNSHQVLGRTLDRPCPLVVCWTDDGSLDGESPASGGTGQALRLAARHGVRVVNLSLPEHRARAERFLARERR